MPVRLWLSDLPRKSQERFLSRAYFRGSKFALKALRLLAVVIFVSSFDSYPWVCVVMVSSTEDMVGGETVLRRGDGNYIGVCNLSLLTIPLVKHLH
jgi:hypothetical protein